MADYDSWLESKWERYHAEPEPEREEDYMSIAHRIEEEELIGDNGRDEDL